MQQIALGNKLPKHDQINQGHEKQNPKMIFDFLHLEYFKGLSACVAD